MGSETDKLLDETGWLILQQLQENARLSFAELGRRVGLSLPAVAERVRRMEEAGIIRGYRADLDLAKLGLPFISFIRLTTSPDRYPAILAQLQSQPEVLECHHVTGGESFVIKVVVSSMSHLEKVIGQLSLHGQTVTSVVLSSPITGRLFAGPI